MRIHRISLRSAVGVLVGLAVGIWPAHAADTLRLSGTILTIERDAGTITVGEGGPSRVEDGGARVTSWRVRVDASTRVVRAERREEAGAAGWPGAFVEIPGDASDLQPGDFVTVVGQRDDGLVRAGQITLVRPSPR
jgi:hypothetical protein